MLAVLAWPHADHSMHQRINDTLKKNTFDAYCITSTANSA
jgi:hypothetical protein